jgi:Patatin-like phospholipase
VSSELSPPSYKYAYKDRVLCATTQKEKVPWRFRSYASPWLYTDDCEIWEACRATSAAPTFFPPNKIGKHKAAFIDGGLQYNNPIQPLLEEASNIWPQRAIGCIVSIGTGALPSSDMKTSVKSLVESLKELVAETEKTAREFKHDFENRYGSEQKGYFRFNVQHGLEHVGIEEWKEFDRVEIATIDYLDDQKGSIQSCVAQLHDTHGM